MLTQCIPPSSRRRWVTVFTGDGFPRSGDHFSSFLGAFPA